jgi:uncharacterized membrane protein YraQ (UPF0718 family)
VLWAVAHALRVSGDLTWQVCWSLILGFTLSVVIESLVHKATIARLLPDDRPRSLVIATGLGAASASCSYAAVALARSLLRKGRTSPPRLRSSSPPPTWSSSSG